MGIIQIEPPAKYESWSSLWALWGSRAVAAVQGACGRRQLAVHRAGSVHRHGRVDLAWGLVWRRSGLHCEHGAHTKKVKPATDMDRAGLDAVQLRFPTGLTSEEYVNQKLWLTAKLDECPLHPEGGCGFARHTPYERVSPPGCLIARWYCREGHTTFSLLPDCLSSRLEGTLSRVEEVVAQAEAAPTLEVASEIVRPDIELPGALRWLRRRVQLVHAVLAAAIGLLPGLLAGCKPTLASFRSALGTEGVLVLLRAEVAPQLAALPPPLGFGARPLRRTARPTALQQGTGKDPPGSPR